MFVEELNRVNQRLKPRNVLPRSVISKKSITSVLDKFKAVHKRRISIEVLARELNPVIRGVINYYCKF